MPLVRYNKYIFLEHINRLILDIFSIALGLFVSSNIQIGYKMVYLPVAKIR